MNAFSGGGRVFSATIVDSSSGAVTTLGARVGTGTRVVGSGVLAMNSTGVAMMEEAEGLLLSVRTGWSSVAGAIASEEALGVTDLLGTGFLRGI